MNQAFGDWLRRQMASHALTIRSTAAALGVASTTVQAWRNGSQPDRPNVSALAQLLGLPEDEVLLAAGYPAGPDTEAPERPSQPIYLRVSIPSQELVIRAEALGPVSLVADPASSDLERQLLEQFRTLKPTDQASLVDAVATMAATAAALDAGALPGQQRRQRKGA